MNKIVSILLFSTVMLMGCKNSTAPILPPLAPPMPVAEFTVSPVIGPAPLTVTCINLTAPANAVMNWQFGDGAITNEMHPVHIFEIPGTYDIVLIAVNEGGSSEMVFSSIVVTGSTPPPPSGFPPGPEEMQQFSFFGTDKTVTYDPDNDTYFDVSVYVQEDGIPGTPSKLGGFGVSLQYSLEDGFAEATNAVWSDYVMQLNGGAGPDLMIVGLYADYGEVNMGCVANVSAPLDFWYLPPSQPMELVRVTFETVSDVLGEQVATIDFNIGDSLVTPNTNTVTVMVVQGPYDYATSATISNGHLIGNSWQVILQPEP